MADVHLHRARLLRDKAALAEARKLIDECSYHRRDGEPADAEEAAKGWQESGAKRPHKSNACPELDSGAK